MSRLTLKKFALSSFALLASVLILGCEPKGPAQQAGENIDNAGKNLKNAVDPRGPAEKLGDKVDQAVGK